MNSERNQATSKAEIVYKPTYDLYNNTRRK